jgi:hypothetical protein
MHHRQNVNGMSHHRRGTAQRMIVSTQTANRRGKSERTKQTEQGVPLAGQAGGMEQSYLSMGVPLGPKVLDPEKEKKESSERIEEYAVEKGCR